MKFLVRRAARPEQLAPVSKCLNATSKLLFSATKLLHKAPVLILAVGLQFQLIEARFQDGLMRRGKLLVSTTEHRVAECALEWQPLCDSSTNKVRLLPNHAVAEGIP